MNLVLKTSLKNIFGKPFRTLLVLFSVFICALCAMVCLDFVASIKDLLGGTALGISKTDCLLYTNDYSVKKLPEGFPESRVLEINTNSETLYKDIEGEAFYVTSEKLAIYGIDIQKAVDMEFIQPVTIGLNETVITKRFADDFGYNVGDKLVVHDRAGKEIELTITGISANETKNAFIRIYSAFVNEETAKIISCGKMDSGMVMIDVYDNEKAADAVESLRKYYPNAVLMNFVIDEEAISMLNSMLKVFYLVFAIAFLLVIFVTASICNRIVSERMPFVGTLRSLGMSSGRTARILLLENVLYAVLGCIPAIIIYGIVRIPILMSIMGVGGKGTSFKTTIPPMKLYAIAGVIFGAIVIECVIPLKAILKALKTSIRDIIFDNRDTAYRFSKSGLVIGIILVIGAVVSAVISTDIIAIALCMLFSVISIALLFPWIFKGVTALIKKIADKKENAKWSLAAVEAISRKSTVGSGVLCVTAVAMSVLIFTVVQGEFSSLVKDKFHCDVVLECIEKLQKYRFVNNLEGVQDTEFVYMAEQPVALNDIPYDGGVGKHFYALPDGGFKYFAEFEGLPEKIEDGSIIVYDKYAEKNNLKAGDTIKLTYNPDGVLPIIREYKIAALFEPKYSLRRDTFFISEHDYKELFKEKPRYCLIKCDDPKLVVKTIKTYAVGSYASIRTHTEVINDEKAENAQLNAVLIGIILVAVGMTFIGMVSNQLIGFEGRKKECAVMLSTAMDRARLSGVLLREMFITAVTSSGLGALVGILLVAVAGKAAAQAEIDVEINPVMTGLFIVFLVLAFTGTALFPIRNLKKMKIAEQIKYE